MKLIIIPISLLITSCLADGPGTLPPEPLYLPEDEKCYPAEDYNYQWNEGG